MSTNKRFLKLWGSHSVGDQEGRDKEPSKFLCIIIKQVASHVLLEGWKLIQP